MILMRILAAVGEDKIGRNGLFKLLEDLFDLGSDERHEAIRKRLQNRALQAMTGGPVAISEGFREEGRARLELHEVPAEPASAIHGHLGQLLGVPLLFVRVAPCTGRGSVNFPGFERSPHTRAGVHAPESSAPAGRVRLVSMEGPAARAIP